MVWVGVPSLWHRAVVSLYHIFYKKAMRAAAEAG